MQEWYSWYPPKVAGGRAQHTRGGLWTYLVRCNGEQY